MSSHSRTKGRGRCWSEVGKEISWEGCWGFGSDWWVERALVLGRLGGCLGVMNHGCWRWDKEIVWDKDERKARVIKCTNKNSYFSLGTFLVSFKKGKLKKTTCLQKNRIIIPSSLAPLRI